MKLTQKMMTGAAVFALMSGAAFAQETTMDPTDDPVAESVTEMPETMAETPMFTSLQDMTVGDVVGLNVHDREGNDIGEIDYVVAQADGAAGVIGIGGFLGLGEYTVAIALEEFQLGDDGASLVLGADKESLKALPEFDESGVEGLPDDLLVSSLITDTPDATAPTATDTMPPKVESGS
ncbi:hypothetical protein Q4577_11380 [Marinovum sp. 2_MG-2023]|uniref:hypothetical protein n=1 Tax=Roseobacteraceae TaxID=2854170 RepID=UPI001FD1F996|nr:MULTISPECIES: hypothetical protein [Roseobacteraceae]MCJ7875056.1 hypothetical protein [Phaeobacter sp. J2-8]MDO6730622.1 hypothetical protein [Marinovum sp. 2_MG-2023]MDO6778773.1 hypothetical protein [Marinovum sp. 1_MG-2023]